MVDSPARASRKGCDYGYGLRKSAKMNMCIQEVGVGVEWPSERTPVENSSDYDPPSASSVRLMRAPRRHSAACVHLGSHTRKPVCICGASGVVQAGWGGGWWVAGVGGWWRLESNVQGGAPGAGGWNRTLRLESNLQEVGMCVCAFSDPF